MLISCYIRLCFWRMKGDQVFSPSQSYLWLTNVHSSAPPCSMELHLVIATSWMSSALHHHPKRWFTLYRYPQFWYRTMRTPDGYRIRYLSPLISLLALDSLVFIHVQTVEDGWFGPQGIKLVESNDLVWWGSSIQMILPESVSFTHYDKSRSRKVINDSYSDQQRIRTPIATRDPVKTGFWV